MNEENKKKVLIGVGAVAVATIGLIVASTFKEKKEVVFEDKDVIDTTNIADFIATANNEGLIQLIQTKDSKVINELDISDLKDVKYSRSNDLKSFMSFDGKAFKEITIEEGTIKEEEVFSLNEESNILNFVFNNKYIIANSGDKLLIFNKSDKSTDMIEIGEGLSDYILSDNSVVYSVKDIIYSYDLMTKEKFNINLSEETTNLTKTKDSVIAFNKFGDGLRKSTILELSGSDLYVKKANKHDQNEFTHVFMDSDNSTLDFICKNEIFSLNLEEDKKTKKSLVGMFDYIEDDSFILNEDNTVISGDYIYTLTPNGNIQAYDKEAGYIENTFETKNNFFMPFDNIEEVSEDNIEESNLNE